MADANTTQTRDVEAGYRAVKANVAEMRRAAGVGRAVATRRDVLAAAGAAAITGTMAGCSSPSGSTSPEPSDTPEPTTAANTDEPIDPAETHEVLLSEDELPSEPQHDVEDLRDLMIVTERENESIAIVDTTTHERIGRVEDVGEAIHVHDFHGDLPDSSREGAYVYTQSREGWMYKVDLFGFNRVARVRAGIDARDIAVSENDEYVAGGYYDPHRLLIADAQTLEPIEVFETEGTSPDDEVVSSQVHALFDVPGKEMFLAALAQSGSVWLLDYSSEPFEIVDIPTAGSLHDGFFGPDNRYFFIASQADAVMGVIDTEKRELAGLIDTADVPHPGPGAYDVEHNLGLTTHLGEAKMTAWDLDTFETIEQIDVPGTGLFLRNHANSPYVWADVAFDGEDTNPLVYQVDLERLEVHQEIDTSEWGGIRAIHPEFTRDGSEVYISLWDAGKLLVFDSATGELTAELDGFHSPTGKFLGNRASSH